MKNILFICTGNTCRSPMAAAILQNISNHTLNVRSAGIFATSGEPASEHAQTILKKEKIHYSHQAHLLEQADLEWADLILTMTINHKQLIALRFPTFTNKIFALKEYVLQQPEDIPDPFGGDESIYQIVFNELSNTIEQMMGLPKFQKLCKNNEKGHSEGAEIMKVAIASDHGGIAIRQEIIQLLEEMKIEHTDFGCAAGCSVDYPDYALSVAEKVATGEYTHGILICGTGIGMSIAANKVTGIRCALVHDTFSAKATREHNDSNILAMGERVIGVGLAREIASVWLTTEFQGGRHANRVDKITAYEQKK